MMISSQESLLHISLVSILMIWIVVCVTIPDGIRAVRVAVATCYVGRKGPASHPALSSLSERVAGRGADSLLDTT